jgi:hypothetical protein
LIFLEGNSWFSYQCTATQESQRAYAIEFWFRLSYREGSARERLAPRLVMGIAIPRDEGDRASGMAAAREERMARKKECEKNISDGKFWDSKRAEED